MPRPITQATLLSATTATLATASASYVECRNAVYHNFYITTSGGPSGAVTILHKMPSGDTAPIHEETVTTATTKNVLLTGQLEQVAAIVPTYATGTFGVQYLGGC
jgi:DNA repair protein RadC